MKNELIATGRVEGLSINGGPEETISFSIDGPQGDTHKRPIRQLSDHDGAYISTSNLVKGRWVFNWRSWTGISREEIAEIEHSLSYSVPQGCLLENISVSGIPNFSKLPPTSRLVFPLRQNQAILAVWGENGPCRTVGQRLEQHHGVPNLGTRFIKAAQGKRGVMGFVLAAGRVEVGDKVRVYGPVE